MNPIWPKWDHVPTWDKNIVRFHFNIPSCKNASRRKFYIGSTPYIIMQLTA